MSTETPRSLRVFINAVAIDVPSGASVLDAVRCWNEAEAAAVSRGEKLVTDSRGLPIETDHRVSAGSIFRLIPARRRNTAADDAGLED
jgi:hypothetical protein